jgi:glycosyltransferase involved in cell wall biosynthesis
MSEADLFVFASSCENMPVTLLECMSMGLPIACSRRGPMPEVLGDGGIYFDPHNSESIAEALDQICQSPNLRLNLAHAAKQLSKQYSWQRCADETFAFISNTYKKVKE